jgi:hypothetical protein
MLRSCQGEPSHSASMPPGAAAIRHPLRLPSTLSSAPHLLQRSAHWAQRYRHRHSPLFTPNAFADRSRVRRTAQASNRSYASPGPIACLGLTPGNDRQNRNAPFLSNEASGWRFLARRVFLLRNKKTVAESKIGPAARIGRFWTFLT